MQLPSLGFRRLSDQNESDPERWREDAVCAETDPDSFFPDRGGSSREAKRVCRTCDVRQQCLEYAVAHDQRFGIWGGMTERERHRYEHEHRDSTRG